MSLPPSSSMNTPSPNLKTYFKTPEGRYKLQHEKTHPSACPHNSHGKAVPKAVTKLTIAHLKEKPATQQATTPTTPSSTGGVRSAAARFLGGGNRGRALSFVGGNGSSKVLAGCTKIGGSIVASISSNFSSPIPNFDGSGTYLIFNVADTLFISDLNSQDKDPIKTIHFNYSYPICHAFDAEAKAGHDLLIGLHSGDVYSASLRHQMQDVGKKLTGAQHYNKDGIINNSRCTCIAWVPQSDGIFVVGHADGNLYVYEKNKEGSGDSSFPVIEDPTEFTAAHACSSKSNPIARWHVCEGSINNISFSTNGTYLATVGRDGYLRVFDYLKELLICGGKSYYGAILCCAWSSDGKYILTGGEDDLVHVWSMEDRKIVAWGEGHNSWVGGVAFDSYWSAPSSNDTEENVLYRFGSVGQDTQLLLWDLVMDELAAPLMSAPGGSPTVSIRSSHSAHWDNISSVAVVTLQPSPSIRDVPKLSPIVTHRAHMEPLCSLAFTKESVVTACREGHIKLWGRPGRASENSTISKDPPILSSVNTGSSSCKQRRRKQQSRSFLLR